MISCRDVANILAACELAEATGWKRIEVWLHLAMCTHCARFAQHLVSMRKIACALARELQYGPAPTGLRERVVDRLTGKV